MFTLKGIYHSQILKAINRGHTAPGKECMGDDSVHMLRQDVYSKARQSEEVQVLQDQGNE